MIDIILSTILSGVLKQSIPKANVQFIGKQEIHNVTNNTTSNVNVDEIKSEIRALNLQSRLIEPTLADKSGYIVHKPTNDVEVHLDTQLSHKCDLPKRFVYTIWLKKHTFYGCWEAINNQAHVSYESGNVEVYTIKELQQ
jgi:hypothetical protein